MQIDLSDSVYPACLPSADLCLSAEEMVLTSSIDGFNGELPVQSQEECVKAHFSDSDYHFDDSVCAMEDNVECLHTDTGSSLVYPENNIYGLRLWKLKTNSDSKKLKIMKISKNVLSTVVVPFNTCYQI